MELEKLIEKYEALLEKHAELRGQVNALERQVDKLSSLAQEAWVRTQPRQAMYQPYQTDLGMGDPFAPPSPEPSVDTPETKTVENATSMPKLSPFAIWSGAKTHNAQLKETLMNNAMQETFSEGDDV